MALRQLSARGLIVVLAVGALAAGCTPESGPRPTTSPSPTVPQTSTTPSATPTRTESAEEQKQREAFEAAEETYRGAFAEVARLSKAGGATRPTSVLQDLATGDYLTAQMDQLKWLKKNTSRASAAGLIDWVKTDTYSAKQLTLTSCEDYRKVLVIDESGESSKPEGTGTRVYRQKLTLELSEGHWKVAKLSTEAQLKECS